MERLVLQETAEHADWRHTVRTFAERHIAPLASAFDQESRFPTEAIDAARRAGFLGIGFPESYGGDGADSLSQLIFTEEVARVCATSALTLMANQTALHIPMKYGSPQLVKPIVEGALNGEYVCAFCLTEPQSGSNLAALTTTAVRNGDSWVINGQKAWITNAGQAAWYAVLVRLESADDARFGVILVHQDDSGFTTGRPESKMGLRGSPTGSLIFNNCVVPEDRLIGEPGMGYKYMMEALLYSRPLIAAQALGIAQGALEYALRYSDERRSFGQRVSQFQMIKSIIADMTIEISASRTLLYSAAEAAAANAAGARTLVSMAKVKCSDTAMMVSERAIQVLGANGYSTDYPVERMMRDAKVTQIYEGTNEVNRLLVAKGAYELVPGTAGRRAR